MRFETDAGALVLATLLAAHQRGVAIRLVYNVDHPGPIPVPPPPRTKPEAIEALPVPTRAIAGVPDLMHHKFVVRDATDVWSGSTNWTDDSWSRQENVIVRVLGAPALARAFTLNLDELWASGTVEHTGEVQPRPVDVGDGIEVRPWFTPGYGDALSHRVAKFLGRARHRIRIASPVLTSGPILGTLVEVVNERRCDVAGVIDETQVDEVFHQWATNGVSAWKIPLLQHDADGRTVLGKALDPVDARVAARLHAREGRRRRRRHVRRVVQFLALRGAKRGERARDPRRSGRRPPRRVHRPGASPLPADDAASDRGLSRTGSLPRPAA